VEFGGTHERARAGLEAIREQLGVETILRGSIRSLGDRLRITAQFDRIGERLYLWSETLDRSASDVFAIEEEIAQAIVKYPAGALWPESPTRLTPKAPTIECYNAYLKGRFHWNKRSPEGLRLGLAVSRMPWRWIRTGALAWAGLGDSFAVLAENGLLPQETAIPAANVPPSEPQVSIPISPKRMRRWAFALPV